MKTEEKQQMQKRIQEKYRKIKRENREEKTTGKKETITVNEHIISDTIFHFNSGKNLRYCAYFFTLNRNVLNYIQIISATFYNEENP